MVRKLIYGLLSMWNIVVLGLFLSVFTLAEVVWGNLFVLTIVNALYISMAVLISVMYGPVVLDYIRENRRVHYVATGIFTIFFSIGASRVWSVIYIYLGRPDWMMNHWFPSLCFLIASSSGFFFLRAPDNLPNHHHRSWKYLLAALAMTAMITAGIIITVAENTR